MKTDQEKVSNFNMSTDQIAAEAAERICFNWGRATEAEVTEEIKAAIEKATEDLQHDCKRLAETLAEVTRIRATQASEQESSFNDPDRLDERPKL